MGSSEDLFGYLDYLLQSLPADDAFTEQLWWLQPIKPT